MDLKLDLKHFDEVLKYVNDLSNTIDLDSTRVRAEALFYRFKRLVEAADRKATGKDMTGLPEVRQQRVGPGPAKAAEGAAPVAGSGPNISEELRALLDRSVIKVQGQQN